MVICCVPNCGADSWKCDGAITFYDFPANSELASKWIKQINTAVKTKPMWFPHGKSVICSKHFLHTDFKNDTDSLKPHCIPTVFGHKYIGQNPEDNETDTLHEAKKSPLIVKVVKPQVSIIENYSDLRILDVRTENNVNDYSNVEREYSEAIEMVEDNLHVSSHKNIHTSNNYLPLSDKGPSCSKTTNEKSNVLIGLQQNSSTLETNVHLNHVLKGNSKQPNPIPKKILKKKEKSNDLIEIGPNTFLKINPDIIKVNKKQTPSGNTVLQFLMDQKLAKSYSSDLLPKLIQGVPNSHSSSLQEKPNSSGTAKVNETSDNMTNKETVQHILGHIVDTHVCEESCSDLQLQDDDDIIMEDYDDNVETNNYNKTPPKNQDQAGNMAKKQNKNNSPKKGDNSFIDEAPVLLTTNMPLSHCFVDKPKYVLQLKQKSRQIASLKFKINNLTKKVEELEDRCIVQERQLSYSFIKRLKSIRKNAAKGDPSATYILEQIRSYSNNSKMRWSDSTLSQCAIWCRKAPYAYEYFKKAEFFKLPCLGTVKRFIKKHPELKFQKKITKCGPQDGGGDDDESSSDFDFDESDGQNDANKMSEDENNEPVPCETILSVPSEMKDSTVVQSADIKVKTSRKEKTEINKATESISNQQPEQSVQKSVNSKFNVVKTSTNSKRVESNGIPITVDSSNLELQEIILPSGEVVQCYSSSISSSTDIGSQYYIIPNVSDQNGAADHEYNVVQTDSLPVILQNFDTSQLHLQNQDQLIFIANSSGQVECSETEVTSA